MAKKTKQGPAGDLVGGVNLAEVERLLAFMQKHGLEEFEYQQSGAHIRLKKASGGVPLSAAAAPAASASVAQAVAAAPAAAPTASATAHSHAVSAPPAEDLHIVKS